MIDRIREELEHVRQVAFVRHDEDRIVTTEQRVSGLRNKMAAGAYDQPELDEVIANLERVEADNRLAPRDRDMLGDDLSRVRQYRENHADRH